MSESADNVVHARHATVSDCIDGALHARHSAVPDVTVRSLHARHSAVPEPADDVVHARHTTMPECNDGTLHTGRAMPEPGFAMHDYARHAELLIARRSRVYARIESGAGGFACALARL